MIGLKPLTVLFVSTGNAARSILAEALMKQKGGDRFRAWSAGAKALPEIHPHTLALLAAEGISTAGLHTKGWGEFFAASNIVKIDAIVTLSEQAQAAVPPWPGDPVRVHWPIDDPLAAPNAEVMEWKFRKCFNTLEARVAALAKGRVAKEPCELLLQMKNIGMVV